VVDLSPECFAELGIDPRKSPLLTVGAVLGIHVANLWLVVDEMKKLALERHSMGQPVPVPVKTSLTAQRVAVALTDPPRPPNAPPEVMADNNAS